MKKIFLILTISTITVLADAQVAVSVQSPQTIKINSTSNLNYNNYQTLSFRLPANTISWYYVFSCKRNGNEIEQLKLFGSLSSAILSGGITGSLINNIPVPEGDAPCDVILMADGYCNQTKFKYIQQASRKNLMSGKCEIPFRANESLNKCIRIFNNHSFLSAVASIEIVAIVDDNVSPNAWSVELKQGMYELILKNIKNNSEFVNPEALASCIMHKLTKMQTPSSFANLASYELNALSKKYGTECLKELEE